MPSALRTRSVVTQTQGAVQTTGAALCEQPHLFSVVTQHPGHCANYRHSALRTTTCFSLVTHHPGCCANYRHSALRTTTRAFCGDANPGRCANYRHSALGTTTCALCGDTSPRAPCKSGMPVSHLHRAFLQEDYFRHYLRSEPWAPPCQGELSPHQTPLLPSCQLVRHHRKKLLDVLDDPAKLMRVCGLKMQQRELKKPQLVHAIGWKKTPQDLKQNRRKTRILYFTEMIDNSINKTAFQHSTRTSRRLLDHLSRIPWLSPLRFAFRRLLLAPFFDRPVKIIGGVPVCSPFSRKNGG